MGLAGCLLACSEVAAPDPQTVREPERALAPESGPAAALEGAVPDCRDVAPVPMAGAVRLRPVAGAGVSADRALDAAEAAASFWERQGLTVTVAAPVEDPVAAPLGGTEAELALCLGALSPEAADAAALAACEARHLTAPLAEALHRLARPRVEAEVVLVAVSTLVAADSPLRRTGLVLPGVTVVDALGTEDAAVPALPVSPEHTPIVFVDVGTPRRPGDVWTTPAHELGHALGLPHRDGGDAVLMRPGVDGQRCWPGISPGEARAVEARLEVRP